MVYLSASSPPCRLVYGRCNPSHSLLFRFPSLPAPIGSACLAFRYAAEGGRLKISAAADDSGVIRRPLGFSPSKEDKKEEPFSSADRRRPGRSQQRKDEEWLDWEDVILEDTVPLVSFVRMILHSGKYKSGDKLSPEHEKTILERLLPYHPQSQKKIGCGIDYITVIFFSRSLKVSLSFVVHTPLRTKEQSNSSWRVDITELPTITYHDGDVIVPIH